MSEGKKGDGEEDLFEREREIQLREKEKYIEIERKKNIYI